MLETAAIVFNRDI